MTISKIVQLKGLKYIHVIILFGGGRFIAMVPLHDPWVHLSLDLVFASLSTLICVDVLCVGISVYYII